MPTKRGHVHLGIQSGYFNTEGAWDLQNPPKGRADPYRLGGMLCPICDSTVKDAVGNRRGDEAVECEGICAAWMHRKCASLSKAAFESVSKSKDPFYCSQCKLGKMELEVESLRGQIATLAGKLASTCDEISVLKSALKKPPVPVLSYSHVAANDLDLSNARSQVSETVTKTTTTTSSQERKQNLVIFGLPECREGMSRLARSRIDLEKAGDVLSFIDPLVTAQVISDNFRLGKYQNDKTRPLLVKMARPNDVHSILMLRYKLSSRPGIGVKPDMSLEERKVESLLLKERRRFIDHGIERSAIKIRGNSIFVNKNKTGSV